MAKNITELTELTAVATGDLFIVEDISSSTTKKITWDNLVDDGSITTAKLANAAATSDKLATGAASATVTTSQTTTSTSYVDLATVGPSVTVTIGANGLALVVVTATSHNNTTSNYANISYSASGANTITAGDGKSLTNKNSTGGQEMQMSWVFLETGLSAGSTTFTLKYKVNATTGTFSNRRISVIPL